MISIQSLSRFLAVLPLGLAFSSIVIAPVKATTLISNIVNTTSDPANTNVCADTGICSPGDTLDLVTGTPLRIVNNDTGFPITDILYIIAPNQDAVWDLATILVNRIYSRSLFSTTEPQCFYTMEQLLRIRLFLLIGLLCLSYLEIQML